LKAQSFIERLWQPALPARWWPLWAALTPAAALYCGALAMRRRWWRSRAPDPAVPIISVGNLTVGGNGKTPFTLFLASRMRARGLDVAIVSRGWGGTSETAALVSDGTNILMSPRTAGDEPVMMAKSFAGPIAVARRRIDAVKLLAARGHVDALILDDGFQHLRLCRDVDFILVNAARGFGNGWLLPAGPLREPRSALVRADAIVVVDSGGPQTPPLTAARLALPGHLPVIHASIRPRALVRANDAGWQEYPLSLAGQRVVAVSGLADAAGFHAMLTELGATLDATFNFPDHHDYAPHDLENILSAMHGADHIVTTEKDLVKLERFPLADVSLYALRLEVSMDAGDEARLFDLLAAAMHRRRDLRLPDGAGRAPKLRPGG
jgi:tetraacyldisaccharide 4'-kinase